MIKVKIKPNLKIKQNKTRTNQVYFLESRQNWKPKHKKNKRTPTHGSGQNQIRENTGTGT